uniref:FAD-dependent oxidoreductase domain containing 2 n=1 Tax=Lepisosteus oculatus TaxID=7918 RepID=W5N2I0_LEPOC
PLLPLLAALCHCGLADSPRPHRHDYCVLGAGPAGLQMGYFLERSGRDYIILERNQQPGSFFSIYPRHRRLISINKRFTGRQNREFNLRHDWNSLLSDRAGLLFTRVSAELYPPASSLQEYLAAFARELRLRVRYGTDIARVHRAARGGATFTLSDQEGQDYSCRVVLVATGLWVPQEVRFPGWEMVEGYESMPVDRNQFLGQAVLILGKGNSAFETAAHILPDTARVHLYSPSPVRLAWQTHYVGDLRAVNNELLDTYQLKSLDGLVEGALEQLAVVRDGQGRLYLTLAELLHHHGNSTAAKLGSSIPGHYHDNFSLRRPYDRILRCLGFKFNFSIFDRPPVAPVGRGKFPAVSGWYESVRSPGLFVIGAAAHSRDYRQSAGGFVHGFRYTGHSLPGALDTVGHSLRCWCPRYCRSLPAVLVPSILSVTLCPRECRSLSALVSVGHPLRCWCPRECRSPPAVLVPSPCGAGVLVSVGHPLRCWCPRECDPRLYYTIVLLSEQEMRLRPRGWPLPRPQAVHHMVEDFLTEWEGPVSHSQPLRRFLEHCLTSDLRTFYAAVPESCFRFTLTHRKPPLSCRQGYLKKQGLVGTEWLRRHAVEAGLMEDY